MNPYTNRAMIRDQRYFFNRKKETKKILSRIGTRPQSVSIIGKRKIGKSSLLFHVSRKNIAKSYIKDIDNYILVFVDLQEKRAMNEEQFFKLLQREIKSHMSDELTKSVPSTENTRDGFHKLIKKLDSLGKKVVIFIDEFEVVVSNEKFKRDFFSFLRSQANAFNFAFVLSSREELYTFCKRKDIKESNFFNIFTKMWLNVFKREDSLDLIKTLSSEEGYSLEEYSDFILKLAGNHPFYLQVACCAVFDFLEDHKTISEKDFEQIEEEFKNESLNHFKYLWDNLTDREKEIVCTLALGEKIESLSELKTLENKGIIKNEEGGYVPFSSSFAEFVQKSGESENGRSFPPLSPHEFSKIFSAGAREKILRHLLKKDAEMADLVDLLDMTRPGVKNHLDMLLEYKLINERVILSPRLKNEYSISMRGKQELETFDNMGKRASSNDPQGLKVQVKSALAKDEGRHIARLPKSVKDQLKIKSGDYVILENENRKSVQCEAKTIRGKKGNKIFIDKETMGHINVRCGDYIFLKKRNA